MRKFKAFLVVLFLIALAGCATVSSIKGNYARINCADGISRAEAKLIAKNEVIKTDAKHRYVITGPEIYFAREILKKKRKIQNFDDIVKKNGIDFEKYPDSWVVIFRPRFLSFFSLYYLVVVNNQDGEIIKADEKCCLEGLFLVFLDIMKPAVVASYFTSYYTKHQEWPPDKKTLEEFINTQKKQEQSAGAPPEYSTDLQQIEFSENEDNELIINVGKIACDPFNQMIIKPPQKDTDTFYADMYNFDKTVKATFVFNHCKDGSVQYKLDPAFPSGDQNDEKMLESLRILLKNN